MDSQVLRAQFVEKDAENFAFGRAKKLISEAKNRRQLEREITSDLKGVRMLGELSAAERIAKIFEDFYRIKKEKGESISLDELGLMIGDLHLFIHSVHGSLISHWDLDPRKRIELEYFTDRMGLTNSKLQ